MTAGVFDLGPSAVSNIAIHIDYKDLVRHIDFAEVQLFKLAFLLLRDLDPVALLKNRH